MIRIMSELPPGILGFEARGKVTAHDYQTVMMPEINRVASRGERLRVLYHLGPGFESFSVGAMIDDALIGVGRTPAWERAAVVTDKEWVHKSFGIFSAITPIEMRVFHNADLDQAARWVAGEA
jgi:hypothetical protein